MTTNPTDHQLDETELALLRALAGLMIPEDAASGAPAADDAVIFKRMVESVGRDMEEVKRVLKFLASTTAISDAPACRERLAGAVSAVRKEKPASFGVIEAVVARAYYSDPRVLTALGVTPQPPFPAGFSMQETKWSLVDPVRARGPIWRKI